MVSIAKLSGKLTLDTNEWTAGFDRAQKSSKKSTAQMQQGFSSIGNLAGPLSGPLSSLSGGIGSITAAASALGPAGAVAAVSLAGIAAAAAGGIYSLHRLGEAMDRVSKFADQSQRLGIPVAAIQSMDLTARLTGTSLDTLTKAMFAMNKSIGSGGMSLDKRFVQQAKALAAISDPAERAAKATKIFGKSTIEILPLLRDIGKLEESTKLIDRFGLAISDLEAGRVNKLGGEFQKLNFLAEGFWNRGIVAAAPAALAMFDQLFDSLEDVSTALNAVGVNWQSTADTFIAGGAMVSGVLEIVTAQTLQWTGVMQQAQGAWQVLSGQLTEGKKTIEAGQAAVAEGNRRLIEALTGTTAANFIKSAVAIGEESNRAASGLNNQADAAEKLAKALKNPSLERGSSGAISAIQSLGGNALAGMREGRIGGGGIANLLPAAPQMPGANLALKPAGLAPLNPVLPQGGLADGLNAFLAGRPGANEDAPKETTAQRLLDAMLRLVRHVEGAPGVLPAGI